jgi:hypothetical protein
MILKRCLSQTNAFSKNFRGHVLLPHVKGHANALTRRLRPTLRHNKISKRRHRERTPDYTVTP